LEVKEVVKFWELLVEVVLRLIPGCRRLLRRKVGVIMPIGLLGIAFPPYKLILGILLERLEVKIGRGLLLKVWFIIIHSRP
jgi:hypothetical protein